MTISGKMLEQLYNRYNRREFIHPDPLEFLYKYDNIRDREIVGMIASSLAYGRVRQILKSTSKVLTKMGPSPYDYIMSSKPALFNKDLCDFKHRFTTGSDMAGLLNGMKRAIEKYGSLEKCFLEDFNKTDSNIISALTSFVNKLTGYCGSETYLLPSPEKNSACKRLNLFLRWMVRSDEVDPGGWSSIPASKLIVPLDTHMYKTGLKFGLTKRKQANLKTALEISAGFAKISPQDPVKYDFALTRLGIRPDLNLNNIQK